jgi:acyl-CoA synthetase (AMP-forming)/AMP-acid ligase II/alkylation response protein AidB-like acyl-CoA dehydrogenase
VVLSERRRAGHRFSRARSGRILLSPKARHMHSQQLVKEAQDRTPPTLMAALDAWAIGHPDAAAYTFLRDGEVESARLTFGELRRRALAVAARLTFLNAPGERAILVYPPGLEFIVALFGCLYAGVTAVPAGLPNRKRGSDALRRIAVDARAKWILSTGALLEQVSTDIAAASIIDLACVDSEQANVFPETWLPPPIDPTELALLQYTSGTTGSPRGVAVTHANLVDNHQQMQQSFGHDERTVIVSWLPVFHDLGLGTLLMTVWAGARCVLMSPGAFAQNPERWLTAISHYRATTSLAPDFAYDLCVRRVDAMDRARLDLSSWRVAGNGGDPIRSSTIKRFVETFAPCGFHLEAIHPGYGLAEATSLVTSVHPGEAPVVRGFSADALERAHVERAPDSGRIRELVSCGRPGFGAHLAVVDPETREECDAGRVGEIWVSGASVAAGYWGQEAENDRIFRARTADGRGPFLRTGDLGFIDDGHLFVTGRREDLIVICGRSHHPQDIEATVAACHPALMPDGCAAFSIDRGQGGELVIVQEVVRRAVRTLDVAAVVRAIRDVIFDCYALKAHAIVLLKPATLPRTTSGKVRRKACGQAFVDNLLPALASWADRSTQKPEAHGDADQERGDVSGRADRLIDWLRSNAADLIEAHGSDGRRTVTGPLVRDFATQGLLGMQVQPQHGGLGLGHFETARVLEQLAASDFALALFFGLNTFLGVQPVARHAAPQIKAMLLPALAHGRELAAFALDEASTRKLSTGMTVQAKSDGQDRWRLFGTKHLDGVSLGASVINVFAHHEDPPGISAFVVSQPVEGLRQVRDGLSIGLLGLSRDSIVLDGVMVGRANLLGSLGSGPDIAREGMMHARLAVGAACLGGMKRCAQLVSLDGPYRGALEGKLTPNPVTLSRLGSVTARVTALECLVHRTARAIDAGRVVPSEAFASCSILGRELLLRSIDDLMQLGVNGGHIDDNGILRIYRDAGRLQELDGPPESAAELMGAAIMEGDASLRRLVQEVFCAPDVVEWIRPLVEAVRQRMTQLSGALARRAQRWGHTRAGELTAWLVLLAAVDGARRTGSSVELERAHAWAYAKFEHALSSVRFGRPSDAAALDSSDVAATFAGYARTIGDPGPDSNIRDHGSRLESREQLRADAPAHAAPAATTDDPP